MRLYKPGQKFFVIDYETTGLDYEKSQPIEVGIIVCDHEFNAIETYSSLIEPDEPDDPDDWSWLEAYRVHGIKPEDLESAPPPAEVTVDISQLASRHNRREMKPVLVSDNIQFEWHWTARLFRQQTFAWPFHYCGWDSSLLLEATGVGDPKPAHRALADAGLLHAAIVKALDRVRSLR